MNKLEHLAKGAFEHYSERITGYVENWNDLSEERKKAWMLDILCITDHIIEKLVGEFKEIPTLRPNTTSYFKGYNDGMMEERITVKNFIENILEELENNLAD